jgi:hypothetical protein
MGVEIKQKGNQLTYQLVAEKASPDEISLAKFNVSEARDSIRKGKNETESMRLTMEIPKQILYNYLVINGIPAHQHQNWLKDKKNLKRLKKEFPVFCV